MRREGQEAKRFAREGQEAKRFACASRSRSSDLEGRIQFQHFGGTFELLPLLRHAHYMVREPWVV